jgi:hypothetical protein
MVGNNISKRKKETQGNVGKRKEGDKDEERKK